MEVDQSHLVTEMNAHLSKTLELIEKSAADNNAKIREEVKQFFSCAEQIETEIAKKQVSDMNYVKQCELEEIKLQKQNVIEFIEKFDREIQKIEADLRQCVLENSANLIC